MPTFNIGSVNAKIGAQYGDHWPVVLYSLMISLAPSLPFNGEGFSLPFIWMKPYEGNNGKDANDYDVDYLALNPTFNLGEDVTVNPFIMYAYSKDISGYNPALHFLNNDVSFSFDGANVYVNDKGDFERMGLYFLGLNLDANLGAASVWFTGVYEGGTVEGVVDDDDVDLSAYILAAGASANLGGIDVHGQVFYASGDDDDDDDFRIVLGTLSGLMVWTVLLLGSNHGLRHV